jgi:hypothetical protein
METLNWRTARDVQFNEPLIPNPDSPSQLLQALREVRVAFDSGLVHIDPRKGSEGEGDDEFSIYVVPAAAVRMIHYREKPLRPFAFTG